MTGTDDPARGAIVIVGTGAGTETGTGFGVSGFLWAKPVEFGWDWNWFMLLVLKTFLRDFKRNESSSGSNSIEERIDKVDSEDKLLVFGVGLEIYGRTIALRSQLLSGVIS